MEDHEVKWEWEPSMACSWVGLSVVKQAAEWVYVMETTVAVLWGPSTADWLVTMMDFLMVGQWVFSLAGVSDAEKVG